MNYSLLRLRIPRTFEEDVLTTSKLKDWKETYRITDKSIQWATEGKTLELALDRKDGSIVASGQILL